MSGFWAGVVGVVIGSMAFNRRDRRGNFGNAIGNNFSKNEQVKKLEAVVESSAPKDTEVIASRNGFSMRSQAAPLSSDNSTS